VAVVAAAAAVGMVVAVAVAVEEATEALNKNCASWR